MPHDRPLEAIPISSLVTILVPIGAMTLFVVARSAAPVQVSVEVEAPVHVQAPPPRHGVPDVAIPPGLSVFIDVDEGYRVVWSDAPEDTASEASWGIHIPCPRLDCSTGYDHRELSRALRLVKRRHPRVEDLMIVPGPDVTYDSVVHVADLARGPVDDPLFPFSVVSSRGR